MEKAFVNSQQIIVSGKQVFEAKVSEIKTKVGTDQAKIDAALAIEPILLNEKAFGLLLGIGVVPSLAKPSKVTVFSILDDRTEIAKIDKAYLIDACAVLRESDRLKGITYSVPLFEHAITLDYRFQNRIEAIGDISGLIFYFKK